MPTIYLIILNYKLKDAVVDCLRSVQKLQYEDFKLKVLIVDNNSGDDIEDTIRSQFPSMEFIQTGANLGYTGGNNVGIKYALNHGADFIVIMNPDVTVDPSLVQELFHGFSDDKIGMTVPKIYFAPGYEFHQDRYTEDERGKVIWYAGGLMDWQNIIGHHRGVDEVDHGQYDAAGPTDVSTGNCVMIKRSVIETVGLLDERYFMYYEDADYSMRGKKAGFTIRYIPTAKLWHLNGQAAGGAGSPLQDYFISRNRLLFGFQYASVRTKIALARESIRNIFSYKTRRLATIDFYCRRFGKGSYIK